MWRAAEIRGDTHALGCSAEFQAKIEHLCLLDLQDDACPHSALDACCFHLDVIFADAKRQTQVMPIGARRERSTQARSDIKHGYRCAADHRTRWIGHRACYACRFSLSERHNGMQSGEKKECADASSSAHSPGSISKPFTFTTTLLKF